MKEQEAVKQFIDQVRWLYEPEYGDFKRKLGLYIERLEEAHPELGTGDAQKVMANMRSAVVYNPNGDMELTRRQVIQMAHELLGAPSGPLH
ncbi:MAG: hypothetical protein ACXVA9_13265 [Bdellovibrionales bacterium]